MLWTATETRAAYAISKGFRNSFAPSHTPTEAESGMEVCGNGELIRRRAVACTETMVGAPVDSAGCGTPQCDHVGEPVESEEGSFFSPECETDADCGSGRACICGSANDADMGTVSWTYCVDADCHSDADCPQGVCRLTEDECGVWQGLSCSTEADECSGPDDCEGGESGGPYRCSFSSSGGHWICGEKNGGCE